MKFVYYLEKNEKKIGVLKNSGAIVDIRPFYSSKGLDIPKDMNDIIDSWMDPFLNELRSFVNSAESYSDIESIKILAPIEYPKRNILCLGKNYLDHAKEIVGLSGSEDSIPKFPIYFSKIASPAIGDGDIIQSHKEITEMVDYEVELGVIIGKDGINIKPEEAEDYIFGYTIVNDVSARNIQRKHGQWFKGKCLETFCPMGPVIVHKSDIPFPVELNIMCSVNDELRQNSNTKMLIFDIPTIISDLSKGMYLRKGDIIITGTPSGVGLGFKPFKFLKSGDKVVCEIEKIGTLTNIVK
ncbi:fumarylacetoacetate hydrolase family protein [uncultured Ilyobacter sp.]|uniref:fumarylacetoacetate hydrolase family protein n=1 Tax=uncultured Ilyobacter sp. TaxID=544433 RepID=UPI0029C6EBC8|nr:fumarylacetoacetate hydrolase family protein [uncultured Ilyobacter sp.]